jgi:hypothetical protein
MNTMWSCEYCPKKYKTLTGFNNHRCKNECKIEEITTRTVTIDIQPEKIPPKKTPIEKIPPKKTQLKKTPPTKPKKTTKKKISPLVRFQVWKTYIGNKIEAKCFCCWTNRITPFTHNNTFHAGHIKSEANGGEISIGNLLPICSDCNKHMSTINWDDYIKQNSPYIRPRIYGEKIPQETHNKVKQIQSWYKYYHSYQIKAKKSKRKRKRRRKKTPNYQKPTKSFLEKQTQKNKIKRKTQPTIYI